MDILNSEQSSFHAGLIALCLAVSACSTNTPRTPSAPLQAAEPAEASNTASTEERGLTVQVSKAFRQRCSLPEEADSAPRFEFDRATLRTKGRNVLDDVARCLIEGPLKGEVITIIGRADARGSDEHNQELGASRATAARNYLAQRGVPADRMRLLSRGEEGARGNNEASFSLDRRVDLELGDLKNNPILEGSMLQAESSSTPKQSGAASYADTTEGGSPSGSGASTTSGSGTASGSVNAGTGK